jgi:hypothetical protein
MTPSNYLSVQIKNFLESNGIFLNVKQLDAVVRHISNGERVDDWVKKNCKTYFLTSKQ